MGRQRGKRERDEQNKKKIIWKERHGDEKKIA
jgi:hypothetical protein